MIKAAKIVALLGRTAGYNNKQYILKKNENDENFKEIVQFIYNPYHKTGISSAKYDRAEMIAADRNPSDTITYKEMLKYFETHQTGSDTDLEVVAKFINGARTAEDQDVLNLARAIVTQDLQIGVTATTLNKVYGKKFIPKIGCMLGTKFENVGDYKTKWPCIVTEKLDGVRRILIKENGVCRFYSRAGHEDTGLVEILAEAQYLPDNRVYDGELLAAGQYADSIAHRQATNSIGNSGGSKTGLIFNIFDMLSVEDYWKGASTENALIRKILLGATLMDNSIHLLVEDWPKLIAAYGIHEDLKFIRPVPILGVINSINQIDQYVEPIWARGGEGVMLNTTEGLYETKRSRALLKVKNTKEYVLEVIGITEGEGKFEDTLGALIVDYNGSKVHVGSGFTDFERDTIWANPEKYIGQHVEIDSFGESTNMMGMTSLNCPIYKRFAGAV